MGKKKKIKRNIAVNEYDQKNVRRGTEPQQSDSPFSFNFHYRDWLRGTYIKKEKFTNKLADEKMFINYITEFFYKLIPLIQQNGRDMIKQAGTGSWKHCHEVTEDKIDKVLTIAEQIHSQSFDFEKKSGPQLFQFGTTQGIRLICIYDYTTNIITPLFIDYHHLIYNSIKHNQNNFEKYKFCPVENYDNI